MLERYLWRHNSIIFYLYKTIKNDLSPTKELFIDLPGYHHGITTIPVDILVTPLKPDLVVLDRTKKSFIILELSVPFELNIDSTHSYKVDKYLKLISDIKDAGFNVKYYPIEIGSRGYISKSNSNQLKSFCKDINLTSHFKTTKESMCRIALLSSYIIYHSKFESTWLNPPHVSV